MNGLRWTFLVPACILSMLVVTFPLHWLTLALMHVNTWLPALVSPATLERHLYAFGVPYAFVITAAFVAPNHRPDVAKYASWFLGMAIIFLCGFAFGQESYVISITWLMPVLWIAGTLTALFVADKSDKWPWLGSQ